MIRKGITYLLAVVFSFSLLIVNASAVNSSESEELISEEIAEIIADCFIRDFQSMPDSIWTESTAVYDSKALYDQDGNVSAYSFELMTEGETTGYVVVSAYPDVQNKILEFSETAEPLYDKWNLSSGDKVVYTGGLNYYREKQDGSLLTIDGLSVSKEEIPTPLVDCRDASYLPIQTFAVIEDPIDWAETYYGGTFEAVEWKNAFETSCRYRRTQDFSGYYNHCGPTAITNLVELVGWYRSYTPVTSKTGTEIFTEIAKYGMKKGYFLNSNDIFGPECVP